MVNRRSMELTAGQRAILDGARGPYLARCMRWPGGGSVIEVRGRAVVKGRAEGVALVADATLSF
ncbi:MAG: hypothetical protein AAB225_13770 [Acidobacteriota bacterium]